MKITLSRTPLFLFVLAVASFSASARASNANVTNTSYPWNNNASTNPMVTIPAGKNTNFTFSFDSNATSDLVIGLYSSYYSAAVLGRLGSYTVSGVSGSLGAAIEFRLGTTAYGVGITTLVAYDTNQNNDLYTAGTLSLPNKTTDASLYKLPSPQNANGTTTYFVSVYINSDLNANSAVIDIEYLNTTTGKRSLIIRQTNETINQNSTFWQNLAAGNLGAGFDKVGFRTINQGTPGYSVSNFSAVSSQNAVYSSSYPWGTKASRNYHLDIDNSLSKTFTATFTANAEHDFLIGLYSSNFNVSRDSNLVSYSSARDLSSNTLGAVIELCIGGWDNGSETATGTNASQAFAVRYEMNEDGNTRLQQYTRGTWTGNTPFSPSTTPASKSVPMVIPGIRGSAVTYTLTVVLTQKPSIPSLYVSLSYLDPTTQESVVLMVLADSGQQQITPTGSMGERINIVAPNVFNYLTDPALFSGFTSVGFRTWGQTSYSVRDTSVVIPRAIVASICANAVTDATVQDTTDLINGATSSVNALAANSISQGNVSINGTQTPVTQSTLATSIADIQNNSTYSPAALGNSAASMQALIDQAYARGDSAQIQSSALTCANLSINAAINTYNAALIYAESLDLLAQALIKANPTNAAMTALQTAPATNGTIGTQALLSAIAAQTTGVPSSRPTATTYTSLSQGQTAQAAAEGVIAALVRTKLANGSTVAQNLKATSSAISAALTSNPLPINSILNATPLVCTHQVQSNGKSTGTTSPTYNIARNAAGKLAEAIVLTMGNVSANANGLYLNLYDNNDNLLYGLICGGWSGTSTGMSIYDTTLQAVYGSSIWLNGVVSANTANPSVSSTRTTTGTATRIINTIPAPSQSAWDPSNISSGTITLQTPPDINSLGIFWQGNTTNLTIPSTGDSYWVVITQDKTNNLLIAGGRGTTIGAFTGFVWRSPIPASRPNRFTLGNYDSDFTINTITSRTLTNDEQLTLFDQSGNPGLVMTAAIRQNASIMSTIAAANASNSLNIVKNDSTQANTFVSDARTAVAAGITGANQSQTQTYQIGTLTNGALSTAPATCAQIASSLGTLLNGDANTQGTTQAANSWRGTTSMGSGSQATTNGISYTTYDISPTVNGSIAMARAACAAALLWAEWLDINVQTLVASAASLPSALQGAAAALQNPPASGTPTGYETTTLINLVKAQITKLPALVNSGSTSDTMTTAQATASAIITALQSAIEPLIKQAATAVGNVAGQIAAAPRGLNASPIALTHSTQSDGTITGTTTPTYNFGRDSSGKACDVIVVTMGNTPANAELMYWNLFDNNNNLLYWFLCGGWGRTSTSMTIYDTALQSSYGSSLWLNGIPAANTNNPSLVSGATTPGTVQRIINTMPAPTSNSPTNISNGAITFQTPPDLHGLSIFWGGDTTNLTIPTSGNSWWFFATQDASNKLILAGGQGATVGTNTGFVWRSPLPATKPSGFSFGNYNNDYTIATIINRPLTAAEQATLFDASSNPGPLTAAANGQNTAIMNAIASLATSTSQSAVTNDAQQANTLASDASSSVSAGIATVAQNQTQSYSVQTLTNGALGSATMTCAQIISALNDIVNGNASMQGTKQALASWQRTTGGAASYQATLNGITYTGYDISATVNGSIAMARSACAAALLWAEWLDINVQTLTAAASPLPASVQATVNLLQNPPSSGTPTGFETATLIASIKAQIAKLPTMVNNGTAMDAMRLAQTTASAIVTTLQSTIEPLIKQAATAIATVAGQITTSVQTTSLLAAAISDVTNTNIPTLISGAIAAAGNLQSAGITTGSVNLNGATTQLTQSALTAAVATLQTDATTGIAALTTTVKAATAPQAAASCAVNAAMSAYTAALTWAECLDLQAQKLSTASLQNDQTLGTQTLLGLILAQAGNIPTTRPTNTTYTSATDAQTAQGKAEALLAAFCTTKQQNGSTLLQNLQAADAAVMGAIQTTNTLTAAITDVTNANIPVIIGGATTAAGNLQSAGITAGSVNLNGATTQLTQSALAAAVATLQTDTTTGIAALTTAVKAATTPQAAASCAVNAAISAYTAALTWAECLDLQAQKLGSASLQNDQTLGTQTLLGLILAQTGNIPTTRPTNTTYTSATDAQTAQGKAEALLAALFTTKQQNGSTLLQDLQAADSAITTGIQTTQSSSAASTVAGDITSAETWINNALTIVTALGTAGITTTSGSAGGTTVSLSSATVSDLQTNTTYGTNALKNLAGQLNGSSTNSTATIANSALYTVNAAISLYSASLTCAVALDVIAQKVLGSASDKSLQTNAITGTQSIIAALVDLKTKATLPPSRPTAYSNTATAQNDQAAAHAFITTLSSTMGTNLLAAANAITNQAIQNATSTLNKVLPDAKTADTNAQAAITTANNLPSSVGNKNTLITQARALQNNPASSGSTSQATGTGPSLDYVNAALKALPTGIQSYTTIKDALTMCSNALSAAAAATTIAGTTAEALKAIAALQSTIANSTGSLATPQSSSSTTAAAPAVAAGSPLDILNKSLTTGQKAAVQSLTGAQTQAQNALATLKAIAMKASGSARATATSLQSSIGDLLNKINTTLSTVKQQTPPFSNQAAALKAKATIESATSYVRQVAATLAARSATIANLQGSVSS